MWASLRLRHCFSVRQFNPGKNYYSVLGVAPSAALPDIKAAFRTLAKKYHPDANRGQEELFKEVNEAYQVLSDASLRQQYDQARVTQAPQDSPRQNSQSNAYRDHPSHFRGYQPEEGWRNKAFREQFMQDLYRQQQNQRMRGHFQQAEREKMERIFREAMQEALRRDPRDTMRDYADTVRQYSESAKQRQAEARRRYEEEERRRVEEEYQAFRRYRDDTSSDTADKVKAQLNKAAEGIAQSVGEALRWSQQIKDLWQRFKENNKK